jgi:archaellum biogenesis ATPase FlaH
MKNCYVSNKGHYDKLQNNVQGFLYDSLTPFFKNEGFREFSDNKQGGAFGNKIIQTIKQENLDNVMILFGGRGSGKSTFLKRFLFHQRPVEFDMYAKIAIVDLIDAPQSIHQLTQEIWQRVLKGIDKDNIKQGDREQILELFSDEFDIYKRQILKGLNESDSDYQKLVREFITKNLDDTKLFAEKISTYWKIKNKGLIVFLDNMDQLSVDLQDVCYLTAVEIAKKLSCLVIISMREERFYNAKSKGVLDAYHTSGYHLTAPVVPEVLIKRLNYIKEQLTYTEDVDFEFNVKNDSDLITIQNFLQICIYQLAKEDSNLSKFVRYATHGDVRQALEFFKGFISSGYTNVDEISHRKYWTFQTHQVIKPMMAPDRIFYDETLSKIPNIFQLRNDNNSSHFTGLRILDLLDNKYGGKNSTGFIDAKYFVQEFEEKFALREDCENHLNIFLNKGLIEASNRLEEYCQEIDQIKITAFGKYLYEFLSFDFSYIDLICLDCGNYNEELSNYLIESASKELRYKHSGRMIERIELRLERAKRFVEYLIEQEEEEARELNLLPEDVKYSSKLAANFVHETERVRLSASKNADSNLD